MRLSQNTVNSLRQLIENSEVTAASFNDQKLLRALQENGIVRVTPSGKTRKVLKLVSEDDLVQYVLVNYALDLNATWAQCVREASLPEALKEALLTTRIAVKDKTDREVVTQLESSVPLLRVGMSKRQMSAVLFWGLSKVLDDRADIVRVLQGTEPPVMLNVYGSSNTFQAVLFIENYDMYVRYTTKEVLDGSVVIYSAGFSSSALRVRERDGCALHYASNDCLGQEGRERFESWLWQESAEKISVSFFGDFDYSGIEIFKSLRRSFSEIAFFKPGYDAMLEEVKRGNGHAPAMADKEKQKYPNSTGEAYCDEVLLPAMREYGFYDQEGIVLGFDAGEVPDLEAGSRE